MNRQAAWFALTISLKTGMGRSQLTQKRTLYELCGVQDKRCSPEKGLGEAKGFA